MKKVLITIGVIAGIFIILIAVGSFLCVQSCRDEKSQGEEVITQYFQAVKNQDLDQALGFYSKEFFQTVDYDSWVDMHLSENNQLGTLEQWKQESWGYNQSSADFSCNETTRELEFEYKTTYTNGTSTESFRLVKTPEAHEYLIFWHKIDIDES